MAQRLRQSVRSLDFRYPLADLDGMSVWYETRLLEEGVEDLQNLATANLVDVILHTRVPVGRLVDWVDQAILLLHLEAVDDQALDGLDAEARRRARANSSRERLRRLGIRTATDLEDAFRAERRDPSAQPEGLALLPPGANDALLTRLADALEGIPGSGISAVHCLLKTFEREYNLTLVRNWKADWRDPFASTRARELPASAA